MFSELPMSSLVEQNVLVEATTGSDVPNECTAASVSNGVVSGAISAGPCWDTDV